MALGARARRAVGLVVVLVLAVVGWLVPGAASMFPVCLKSWKCRPGTENGGREAAGKGILTALPYALRAVDAGMIA